MKNFNYYLTETSTALSKELQLVWKVTLLVLSMFLFIGADTIAQKPAASLEQIRNGGATDPTDPAQWQNGNAGNQTAHYVEGHSIGYRALLSGLPIGEDIVLVMGFDVTHSSKNAIDYLTHYDRLQPHGQFLVGGEHPDQEVIDPTIGTSFSGDPTDTEIIPRPYGIANTPAGISYDNLEAGKNLMSIWGGTITSIEYVTPYANFALAQAEQRIRVTLRATSSSAVLAWGGHIASRLDWGFANGVPNSAGGINGSPYHMRLVDWNLGNLGNQDRSLSAAAVIPPPVCNITPTSAVCEGVTTLHTASAETGATYVWTVSGQGVFVSGTTELTSPQNTGTVNTISVKATGDGSYILGVTITSTTGLSSNCNIEVPTYGTPAAPAVTYTPPACDETTFSVEVTCPLSDTDPTGPQYEYSNNGGAYQPSPVFSGITAGAGFSITVRRVGTTCVSVATDCNNYTTVTCPPALGSTIDRSSTSSSAIKSIKEPGDRSVTAYPVPFRDRVNIDFKSERSGNYSINLYDSKGKLVKELKTGKGKVGQLQSIEVDGRNLPDGMYFIRVVDGAGSRTVKLLKKE